MNTKKIKTKAVVCNAGDRKIGVLVGIVGDVPTLIRLSPANATSGELLFPLLMAARLLGYSRDRRFKKGWRKNAA